MGDDDDKSKRRMDPTAGASFKHSRNRTGWRKGVGSREDPEPARKNEIAFGPIFQLDEPLQGAWADSRRDKSADQKSFVQVLQGKANLEVGSLAFNLTEAKVKAVLVKGIAEGSLVHGELDLVDRIRRLFETDAPPTAAPLSVPLETPAPMAARIGDLVAHGSLLAPGLGSPNVFIGGQPAWRAGLDIHLCPAPGAVPHGMGMAVPGAATVFINGAPAARAGDCMIEAGGGPDMILQGCPTVFIGAQAPPPPPTPLAPPAASREPSVEFQAVAKADVMSFQGQAQVHAEADLKKGLVDVEAAAGGSFAVVRGNLPITLEFPIPGSPYHIGLGITLEGSLLSVGAEGGAGFSANDHGIKARGGAHIDAGLGGVGVKFGFELSK